MHQLPELPYPIHALEPFISKETLEFHHGKHHRAYVDKLNELTAGTGYEDQSLEEIIRSGGGAIFNNAAQAWNHAFFWHCLSPSRPTLTGKLLAGIERDFGSKEDFLSQFRRQALDVFGSGWIWLVKDEPNGKLLIETTSNAETPLTSGRQPILTCDLWEHAYYIDYRNDRAKFLEAFESLVNWDFAAGNFESIFKLAA